MADFSLIIKAVDQATATLNKIQSSAKQVQISADKASQSFSNLQKGVENVSSAASTLKNVLTAVLLGNIAKEVTDLAISYERLTTSLDRKAHV